MTRQMDGSYQKTTPLARRMPVTTGPASGLEGAIIPDVAEDEDKIAVVYDKGEAPPTITITDVSGGVQTVHANGVAVAIVACADGPRLTVDDVLLVERFVTARD
ncbi:hypothetical protein [uncultured Roseobacter sp.]|uniref:hypothetical protein n=1 Tax=uncultured Roseobacter sp. TaxID=114847 RepID=UPI002636B493|nr:hypothetical protein [uncultured Roseobacter sp.]